MFKSLKSGKLIFLCMMIETLFHKLVATKREPQSEGTDYKNAMASNILTPYYDPDHVFTTKTVLRNLNRSTPLSI